MSAQSTTTINLEQAHTLLKLDQTVLSGKRGFIETQFGNVWIYPTSTGCFAEFIDENNVKISVFDVVPSVAFLKVAEKIRELNQAPVSSETPKGICLHDRQTEFTEAFKRGFNNDLELFDGWDKDSYFVKNRTNDSEYKVEFETVNGKTYVQCECKDHIHRQRICKHISFALVETFYKTVLI